MNFTIQVTLKQILHYTIQWLFDVSDWKCQQSSNKIVKFSYWQDVIKVKASKGQDNVVYASSYCFSFSRRILVGWELISFFME